MSYSADNQDSQREQVFEAELVGQAKPAKRKRMSPAGCLIIALFIGLLVAPLLYTWIPGEVARWHLAAAVEQRLDGDLDGAVGSLERAIDQFPESAALKRHYITWLIEKGDYDSALEDTNRLLEANPNDAMSLQLRSLCYQHLGRFQEGVADNIKLLELSEQQRGIDRGSVLNGLAYSRALANSNLDEALDEIQQSLGLSGERLELLDTRGFIYYLRGELDEARADLDLAVEKVEARHTIQLKRFRGEEVGVLDRRDFKLQLAEHAKHVAVLRYHRALVLESLGENVQAEEDLARVVELGFEPGPQLF